MSNPKSLNPGDRPWILLVNPTAGRQGRGANAVAERLRDQGITVQVAHTQSIKEIRDLARANRHKESVVGIFGGDGTANAAASELVGGKAWLALLPGGTDNSLCKEAGLSQDPLRAAEQLLTMSPVLWDTGWVGSRMFLLQAGIGFDGEVVHRANDSMTKSWGPLGYYFWTFLLLFSRPKLFSLVWEGGRMDGLHQVFFSNGAQLGASMEPNPVAVPADGWLDIGAMPWRGRFYRFLQALNSIAIFHGRLGTRLGPIRTRVKKAKIESLGTLKGQSDGEPCTVDNPEITVRPRSIFVLAQERLVLDFSIPRHVQN